MVRMLTFGYCFLFVVLWAECHYVSHFPEALFPGINCDTSFDDLDDLPCRYIPSRGGHFIEHRRSRSDIYCEPVYNSEYEMCVLPDDAHTCMESYEDIQEIPCRFIHDRGGSFTTRRLGHYNRQCELQYEDVYEACVLPTQPLLNRYPCSRDPIIVNSSPCQYNQQKGGSFIVQIVLQFDNSCQPKFDYNYNPCPSQKQCDRTPKVLYTTPCQYVPARRGYFTIQQVMQMNHLCEPTYDSIYQECAVTQPTVPPVRCTEQPRLISTGPCQYIADKGGYFYVKEIQRYTPQCDAVVEYNYEPCSPPSPPPVPVQPCPGPACKPIYPPQHVCQPYEYQLPQPNFVDGRRQIITITVSVDCSTTSQARWEVCGECCVQNRVNQHGCRNSGDSGYMLIGWNRMNEHHQCVVDESRIPCDLYEYYDVYEQFVFPDDGDSHCDWHGDHGDHHH